MTEATPVRERVPSDEVLGTPDEASQAVPEADRLFEPPTAEQAAHALRDLSWGEHLLGIRMAAARGNSKTYLYSLSEAVSFFFDDNSGGMSLESSGAFAWVNFEEFVAWMRDVIGDVLFADVLEAKLDSCEFPNEKIEALRQMLMLRFSQYEPYLVQDASRE